VEIKLTQHADERCTYGIRVSLFDSTGNAVAPKTLFWSLIDLAGVVINDRKDVSVASPGAVETIVLQGDDLQIVSDANRQEGRVVIVKGTYDDTVLGADAPFRADIRFVVDNPTDVASTG